MTCASSCAISSRPWRVWGVYCPVPKTTSWPDVYARAFMDCADFDACVSVWMFTRPKSWPNRDSIYVRVAGSSERPGEETMRLTPEAAVSSFPSVNGGCAGYGVLAGLACSSSSSSSKGCRWTSGVIWDARGLGCSDSGSSVHEEALADVQPGAC